MSGPTGGFLDALHMERSGLDPASGADVFLLIHGYGASTFSWRSWAPVLERRGHVIAIDLLGCGQSAMPPDGPYGPVGQAGLVLELLGRLASEEEIEPGRVTLVGHSLGGGIALLTALELQRAGTPAGRLVVLAGAAYPQHMPPFVKIASTPRLARFLLRAAPTRPLARQVLRSIVFDPAVVTDELVDGYARPLAREGAAGALIASARHIQPPDLPAITERYRSLAVPTLLLWGRHDRVVPAWVGERLARALPDARLRVLERCGHLPQDEGPGASLAALESFLGD
ncbi:MAG: alpha/beta fold hydrolase [Gemmatimonadota bacterium]